MNQENWESGLLKAITTDALNFHLDCALFNTSKVLQEGRTKQRFLFFSNSKDISIRNKSLTPSLYYGRMY